MPHATLRVGETDGWGREEVLSLARHVTETTLDRPGVILATQMLMNNLQDVQGNDSQYVSEGCRCILSRLDPYHFSMHELAAVVRTLLSGTPIPEEIMSSLGESEITFPLLSFPKGIYSSHASQEILRNNHAVVVSSGVLLSLMYKIYPKDEMASIRNGGSSSTTTEEASDKAVLLLSIVRCNMNGLNEEHLEALRSSCLILLSHILCNAQDTESNLKVLVSSCVSVVDRVLPLSLYACPDSESFSRQLLRLFEASIDAVIWTKLGCELWWCLLSSCAHLPSSVKDVSFARLLWKVLEKSINRLTTGDEQTEALVSPSNHDFEYFFHKWFESVVEDVNNSGGRVADAASLPGECCLRSLSLLLICRSPYDQSCFAFLGRLFEKAVLLEPDLRANVCELLCSLYVKLVDQSLVSKESQTELLSSLLDRDWSSGDFALLECVVLVVEGEIARETAIRLLARPHPWPIWLLPILSLLAPKCAYDDTKAVIKTLVAALARSKDVLDRICLLRALHVVLQRNHSLIESLPLPVKRGGVKHISPLTPSISLFDMSPSEYSSFLSSLSPLCLSALSPCLFPPINESFLSSTSRTLSDVVLLVGQCELLDNEEYMSFLKEFNKDTPSFEKTLDGVFSCESFSTIIVTLLNEYRTLVKKGEQEHISPSFYHSLVLIFTRYYERKREVDASVAESLLALCSSIERLQIKSMTETSSDTVLNMLNVWRNAYMHEEKTRFGEGLPNNMLCLLEQLHAPCIVPLSTFSPGEYKSISSIHVLVVVCLRFHRSNGFPSSDAVRVALACLTDSREEQPVQLKCLLQSLLTGITALPTRREFGLNMHDKYVQTLMWLCGREDVPWKSIGERDIGAVIDRCAEDAHLSHYFVVFLDKVMHVKYGIALVRDLFVSLWTESRVRLFPSMLARSSNPLGVFVGCAGLINTFARLVHASCLESVLMECVDVLFPSNCIDRLSELFSIEVQTTDRFSQTELRWRGVGAGDHPPLDEKNDPIKMAFDILIQFSSENLHLKILAVLADRVADWLTLDDQDELVLRGSALVDENKRVVWKMSLLSQLFSYVGRLAGAAGSQEEGGYHSDDEELSEGLTKAWQREKGERGERVLPLCTFTTTEKEFTNQHWYNCYTCGMRDTVGVCSVCAINCHRGHDISYSKCGSFFCDCGERGCASTRHTEHDAFTRRLRRAAPAAMPRTAPETRPTNPIHGLLKEKLSPLLAELKKKLTSRLDMVQKVVECVVSAREGRWTLNERRTNARAALSQPTVKYDQCIMLQSTSETDGLEMLERKGESGDRSSCREWATVIPLIGGGTIVGVAMDTHMAFLHSRSFSFTDPCDVRVERENIGFPAKRVSSLDGKLAVTGTDQVLLMQFGQEGNVLGKCTIRMPDNCSANPLVKSVWAPGRPAVVAIATLQFVRIYDISVDSESFVQELVLPMGSVVDIVWVERDGSADLWLLILCSAGHMYQHALGGRTDVSSIFLTNTVQLPSVCLSISLFYSPICHLLFVSVQSAVYYAYIPEGDVSSLETASFHKLEIEGVDSLSGWSEQSGVIGCLSSNRAVFFYPTLGQLLVQSVALPQHAYALVVGACATNDSVVALALMNGYDRLAVLFRSNWANQPDLWIDGLPREMEHVDVPQEDGTDIEAEEDLVTIFERTEVIPDVEFTSSSLAMYYDSSDLTWRLSSSTDKPVSVVQRTEFDITMTITKWRWLLKAIRIEVSGGKAPAEMVMLDNTYSLSTDTTRVFDIPFTHKQSLSLDRTITMRFVANRTGPTSIISIKAFGETRMDMGWSRSSFRFIPPYSLPNEFLRNLCLTLRELKRNGAGLEDVDWCTAVALKVMSPRVSSHEVMRAASALLRTLSHSVHSYYLYKDKTLFSALSRFHSSRTPLPGHILSEFVLQLKVMMATRMVNFHQNVSSVFGDALSLGSYLSECMNASDSPSLTHFYTLFVFVMLSENHPQSTQLIEQFGRVFFSRHSDSIRDVAQQLIVAYNTVSRQDRSIVGEGGLIMRWGGALPFYSFTKIVNDPKQVELIRRRMGAVEGAECIVRTDMFDAECAWQVVLNRGLLHQIASDPSTGCCMRDCPNSSGILVFTIVLFAHLHSVKLQEALEYTISMIDFDRSLEEKTSENYRQYLLLRIVHTLLTKCSESIKSKANEEEKNDRGTGKSPVAKEKRLEEKHRIACKIVQSLLEKGALPFCLRIISHTVDYWKKYVEPCRPPRTWSREVPSVSDVPPFGLRLVEFINDYTAQVMDLSLRLTLSMVKVKGIQLDACWIKVLCELVTSQTVEPIRRSARKLLIAICGDRVAYRQTKDEYLMRKNVDLLKTKYLPCTSYTHPMLSDMAECISSILSIASSRPAIWRAICADQLSCMLELSCRVADAVASGMLDLLVRAIRGESVDGENDALAVCGIADALVSDQHNRSLLKMLLVRYLTGRDEERRWLVHGLVRSCMQLATRNNQIVLCKMLWHEVWPLGRSLGVRGAQLADLLCCYIVRVFPPSTIEKVVEAELANVREAKKRLDMDGQSLHRQMVGMGLSWRDSLLLDPNPCLICVSRQDAFQSLKISSIRQEAKYTTSAQMIKLNGHYEISRLMIKLSDVKKMRSIRKVNMYYSTRAVESAVDLKSDPSCWQKASSVCVSPSDTDISLAVPIPVVSSGIVIEFADVMESRVASELHCPRCSSVVRPNPGVCDNCGENVFQCVKCRVINYDEKEPFLCSSCGFCKYARMEMSVVCRPHPSVYPICTEAEYVSTVETMGRLLVEIEQTRTHLFTARAFTEALCVHSRPLPNLTLLVESHAAADAVVAAMPPLSSTQSRICTLAQSSAHCKAVHDELCAQTMQLVGLREALRTLQYSTPHLVHDALTQGFYSTSWDCVGCLTAHMIHSLAIVRSLCDENILNDLADSPFIHTQLVTSLSDSYLPLCEEIENLLIRLADTPKGSARLCQLVKSGTVPPMALVRSILLSNDDRWMEKLETLLEVAMHGGDSEDVSLCILNILTKWTEDCKALKKKVERKYRERREGRRRPPTMHIDQRIRVNNKPITMFSEDARVNNEMEAFVWQCVFSPWVCVRAAACTLIRAVGGGSVLSLLVRGLSHARRVPSARLDHFFVLAHDLIASGDCKMRLYIAEFHLHLMKIILRECKRVNACEYEESSVDHSFGTHLLRYTELLVNLFSGCWLESAMLSASRDSLLVPLFRSSVLLRRLILKRTRAIDRSLESLDKMLRRLRAGHMVIRTAVEYMHEKLDMQSQANVLSTILDTIDPEKKTIDDFYIQLEKDAAQEDFLQGRMQHNPYKSSDPGMGPFMRNIKDKICRESELIALLEDENGMELLVNNNIISLALPVRAVYEKIWKAEHGSEPMVVVYRMRGLLGDAVEQFVSSLDDTHSDGDHVDDDEAALTRVLIASRGIAKATALLDTVDLSMSGQHLLTKLRLLLNNCLRIEAARREILSCRGVDRFLRIFEMSIRDEPTMHSIGLPWLKMIEPLVCDLSLHPLLTGISREKMNWLLELAVEKRESKDPPRGAQTLPDSPFSTLTKLIPNLCLGNDDAENLLVERFERDLKWDSLTPSRDGSDGGTSADVYCNIASQILPSQKGRELKQKILDKGIIKAATEALVACHPPLYGAVDSNEWKTYLARPNVKIILRLLCGMAKWHSESQEEIARDALPLLHRLEQISCADHMGTLAENVMEELRNNPSVAQQIEAVRQETKQKKRQMAMAMRDRQLSKLGMALGNKGEVKVSSRTILNEPDVELQVDPLTSCCICRESVLTGPRVPATYAFACPSTDTPFPTHSSVSLMVIVHVDCHHNAIRRSTGGRGADEWSKAALHNSGARTNVLVPIRMASPSLADWSSAVARMQSDIDSVVPAGSLTRQRVFADMSGIVSRFILQKSFSESSGGGGRESNVQYLAVLHLLALSMPAEDLVPFNISSRLVAFLFTELTVAHWNEQRIQVLQASLSNTPGVRGWPAAKHLLLTWTFVDKYFNLVIPIEGEERLEWLQDHFSSTLRRSGSFVNVLDEIIKLNSVDELCAAIDVPKADIAEWIQPGEQPQQDNQLL